MGLNQIINMIMRMIMRRVVNKGIDAGLRKATGGGKKRNRPQGRQNREQPPADPLI